MSGLGLDRVVPSLHSDERGKSRRPNFSTPALLPIFWNNALCIRKQLAKPTHASCFGGRTRMQEPDQSRLRNTRPCVAGGGSHFKSGILDRPDKSPGGGGGWGRRQLCTHMTPNKRVSPKPVDSQSSIQVDGEIVNAPDRGSINDLNDR